MIESIEFHNFKVLRDCTLPLGPCNILVGPNGSGKSTVLQALTAVREPNNVRLPQIASVTLRNEAEPEDVRVALNVKHGLVRSVCLMRWDKDGVNTSHVRKEQAKVVESMPLPQLASVVKQIRVYSLDAKAIARQATVQPQIELGADGSKLAAVLDGLRDTHPDRFDAINQAIAAWLPEFGAVLFERPEEGHKSIVLESRGGKYRIPASNLSQGTLLALAILTLAYLPEPPPLIGLEEPDRGIHPRLLRHVADAIHRLSFPQEFGEDREPVQVIATTHSPYFLDLFKDHPEEIIICERTEEGVRFQKLSERADINEILAGAPLGEVWYSGVLGGVPAEP